MSVQPLRAAGEAARRARADHARREPPQHQADRADLQSTADDVVDELLEQVGYEPEHVALLTTGRRHPVQREGQEEGQDLYWRDFFEARATFYGHVLDSKDLERPVVVLAVNGFGSGDGGERAREKLYVGLSRARDLLVVCGGPDMVREAGGEGVARRLGIR